MKLYNIASLFLLLLSLACCGQKDVMYMKRNMLMLRLDDRWSKQESDSILSQYGMKGLSIDSIIRFGYCQKFKAEGWRLGRHRKHIVELYKPLDFSSEMDMAGIPFVVNEGMFEDKDWEENAFNDRVFGRNTFRQMSVIAVDDSTCIFRLRGYSNARSVVLSGSFNDWSTNALQMGQEEDGWSIALRLPAGRHEYKFIVDGRWMRDPDNDQKIPDNVGDYNSVYFKTNYTFRLKAKSQTKEVILSGNFNNWNEDELRMTRIGEDFVLDVFLPEGTWFYKFIVDGQWITDPANPDQRPDAYGNLNSCLIRGETTVFKLQGYEQAQQVVLSGSFNDWNENNLVMQRSADGWIANLALRPGYYEYRYIVDGQWVSDKSTISLPNEYNEANNLHIEEPNYTFRTKLAAGVEAAWITGSFIDWRLPGIPLRREGDGWTTELWLPRGKTSYKINVSGELILDPVNDLWEDNEFNTGNSIIWKE